jgi:hypothetical protein
MKKGQTTLDCESDGDEVATGNMNEELRAWMAEHGVEMDGTDESDEPVAGLCELCEIREAVIRCIECGKQVCRSCSWTMLGICKDCLTEEQFKEFKEHHF